MSITSRPEETLLMFVPTGLPRESVIISPYIHELIVIGSHA